MMAGNKNIKTKIMWLLYGAEGYGVKKYILEIMHYLLQNECYEFHIIAVSEGNHLKALERLGAKIYLLHLPKLIKLHGANGRRSLLRFFWSFCNILLVGIVCFFMLLKIRPKIVHTHTPNYHLLANLISYPFGIKTVWHWHGPYVFFGFPDKIFRILSKKVTATICISKFVKKTLPACFDDKAIVIHNGTNLKATNEIKTNLKGKFKIPDNFKIVGAIGQIIPRKGFQYFVEAASKVLKEKPDTYFWLAGEPRDSDSEVEFISLKKMVEDLGISNRFIFLGFVEDVSCFYKSCDAIVVPTIPYKLDSGEGFGLVVVEAMSYKVPVIATECGAFPEIIEHNNNGLLVTPKSAEGLSNAMLLLLNDNELINNIKKNAYGKVVTYFNNKRVSQEIDYLYKEILN